ncbi:MAG: fumarate hydratase [Flavobacteriaceae bacterium]|nr:fumarate hydratase [Flavobacteriaceae bacterium]
MYTIISGDIISSTSLHPEHKKLLRNRLQALLEDLDRDFSVYGRIIKGDYIECYVPNVQDAMQVLLAIKSYVKAIPVDISNYDTKQRRAKSFREYGIRLALGFGNMQQIDIEEGILDGEAIYMSGRMINSTATHNTKRITIKNTLFFVSKDEQLNSKWEAILGLVDVLLSKATSRQSEVLYLRLTGASEKNISERLGIDQSVVNRHSTSVGWNAIEGVVDYFRKTF